MPATPQEATDEILTTFRDAWIAQDSSPEVTWPTEEEREFPPDVWASVTLTHGTRTKASISGSNGKRRYRPSGVFEVQINVALKHDDCLTESQRLARVVTDALENKQTPLGVIFEDVTAQEIGRTGRWFLTSVTARFEYDEIR